MAVSSCGLPPAANALAEALAEALEEAPRNIKLTIAYDGTDFFGWQRQGASGQGAPGAAAPGGRTVQGVLEEALRKMHKAPVRLTGCGRTDSGVHAAGQVANFYTNIKSIKAASFVPALNSLLPKDLRVLAAEEVHPSFHSRFDAVMRTYRYFFISRRPLPHESRYCLWLGRYPQIGLLNTYGGLLLGERDCKIFAGAGDKSRSSYRYIKHAHFFAEGDRLVFEISANAFMLNMVRSVAGTLLFYEEKNTPPAAFRAIIASGNRSLAGPT
ncbi:MAG: tRNA pseudouridine(38-40) synthase TruA, partial [Spirochaetes bacterium]|nr:tRNA pseudouridine(38-40) synthase TruA [Spirochaetota bacterium]